MRFTIDLPADAPLADRGAPLALSPDGARLVYAARDGTGTQLYQRGMDELSASLIPGTEGAQSPFFSPDGDWIGYFDSSDSKLKKIALEGGDPVALCDVQLGLGAAWNDDDTIIFAPNVFSGLWRIPAGGGTPEVLTQLEENEFSHRWPEILPGGDAVIFTAGVAGVTNQMRTVLYSLKTGEKKSIEWGSCARYASSGHLVFYRAGDLMAVRFDMRRLETQGTAVTILRGVGTDRLLGSAYFALSSIGSLAYVPRDSDQDLRTLVWVDREQNMQRLTVNQGVFSYPRLSPDGGQLAVVIYSEQEKSDIWIVEVDTGAFRRLTTEGNNILPVWTHDGWITFSSDRSGRWSLYWMRADGTGSPEQLAESRHPQIPSAWSPDGKYLAYTEFHPTTGADIWVMSRGDNPDARPFLRTPSGEWGATFSPDGRWLAYTSDELGPDQVFVKPYPGPGESRQISTAEGREPLWGPGGAELFYRYWRRLMAVSIETAPEFLADAPRVIHEGDFRETEDPLFHNYDISPDGQRFVVIHGERRPNPSIRIDLNCFEFLQRINDPTVP
jgi:serine/threonine-protein kinase